MSSAQLVAMAPKVAAKAAVRPRAIAKGKVKEDGNRWKFTAARFVYQGHLDFASVLEHFGDKVAEYSIAHEAGTHKHTDVYAAEFGHIGPCNH